MGDPYQQNGSFLSYVEQSLAQVEHSLLQIEKSLLHEEEEDLLLEKAKESLLQIEKFLLHLGRSLGHLDSYYTSRVKLVANLALK